MSMPAVAVELVRGGIVESRHRVSVAVAEAGGRVLAQLGDVTTPTFPRSAIKPIQALPLVETGAADAFGCDDADLALACASHGGEPRHTTLVAAWLARAGLSVDDLECGGHAPSHPPSAQALVAAGETPTSLHNNCSGKHTGMLTTSRHLGEPTAGYLAANHPVQRRVEAAYEDLIGAHLAEPGIDGCGVPSWPVPLTDLAKAMANMLDRGAAAARLFAAMRKEPFCVAGSGRLCTALMTARPDIVAKTGAEGVYVAVLPERRHAIALKAEDGGSRAAKVALLAVLERLVGGIGDEPTLAPFANPEVRNVAGLVVGELRQAPGWPSF